MTGTLGRKSRHIQPLDVIALSRCHCKHSGVHHVNPSPASPASELRSRLLAGCPLVFRGWAGTDSSARPWSGRIECGPGWDALIEVLFETLEEGAQRRVREGLSPLLAPAALEIKERHGELRVHLYHAAPWTERWVGLAARRSRSLCVDCGAEVMLPPDVRVVDAPRCGLHAPSNRVRLWRGGLAGSRLVSFVARR